MSASELLGELKRRSIELSVEPGDRLRFRAPKGQLTDELRGQIREHRAELMRLLADPAPAAGVLRESAGAALPFTPNQIWYLETVRPSDADWSNIVAWEVKFQIEPAHLQQAIAVLYARHDIFRLRRYRQPDGSWAQRIVAFGELPPIELRDFRTDSLAQSDSAAAPRAGVAAQGRRCQTRLSCLTGPILALGVRLYGGARADQLVMAMHHFDAYSVVLLMAELLSVYAQLAAGEPVRLPPTSASYADYLRTLHAHCSSGEFLARQRRFWLAASRLYDVVPVPKDFPGGKHLAENSRPYRVALSPLAIDGLDEYVASHAGVSVHELIVFGLVRAYGRWTGGQPLLIDIEHNGRAGLLTEIDLSRTLGPTTIKVPFLFVTEPAYAPEDALRATVETLRATMDHALGYGFLRWVRPDPEAAETLAAHAAPELFFNNRSSLPRSSLESVAAFSVEAESLPDPATNQVTYTLVIECQRSPELIELTFRYSTAIHREATISALAHAVIEEITALTATSRPD